MKENKKEILKNTMVGLANAEKVDRYGSASAEYLKGLRGIDRETGQVYDRSLLDVKDYKINPEHADKNVTQQAGFSAEIAKVSKDNAKNIIEGNNVRVSRTEDIASFGKNHTVADHIELIDGVVDPSSISQMKFLSDTEGFLTKVARGKDGGKNDLSRYMENKAIDLPTEQVESAKAYCHEQARSLREQADKVDSLGKSDLAEKFRQDANNFEKLEGKIRDGGLTRDEAKNYRLNPEWETAKDIAKTSHDAAMEGAKVAAAIGAAVSIVMNGLAVYSGEKDLEDAALDVVKEVGVITGVGYVGTFAGSALKGYMQQAEAEAIRAVSKTALPALAVTTCLALGKSVTAYANGSINERELAEQMGGTVTSTLAASMGATVGQIAIPIPVLGAVIGGMVGSTVSGIFYQAFVESGKRADIAYERYIAIKAYCEVAKGYADAYRQHIEMVVSQRMLLLEGGREQLISVLATLDETNNADVFAKGINDFALLLGRHLEFDGKAEFDAFMSDNKTFTL